MLSFACRRATLKETTATKGVEIKAVDHINEYCDLIVDNPENIYESISDAVYQNTSLVSPMPFFCLCISILSLAFNHLSL